MKLFVRGNYTGLTQMLYSVNVQDETRYFLRREFASKMALLNTVIGKMTLRRGEDGINGEIHVDTDNPVETINEINKHLLCLARIK